MRYLDVTLEFPAGTIHPVELCHLKNHVMHCVRKLFGQTGTESQVDILKLDSANCRFILRCESDNYVKLRAALTLATKYGDDPCSYTIHRASGNLLSLAVDSRAFIH